MSVKRYEWVACDEHSCHCDVVESAEGDMVDYEDYAALEAKCAALAAEAQGFKRFFLFAINAAFDGCDITGDQIQEVAKEIGLVRVETYSAEKHAEMSGDPSVMEEGDDFYIMNKTPATDAFLAEVRASGVETLSNAAQSVIAERQRQQSAEGWTPEHDDQYGESQLLWASSCYVLNTIQPFNRIPLDWPWAPEWWKPTNPRRDLVKAGALILAEIERIDRQEAAQ